MNCFTRKSSGTRARSLAARTSASIAASLPMSFFLSPIGLIKLVAAGVTVVAAVVVVVVVLVVVVNVDVVVEAASASLAVDAFVVSAVAFSASLGFLFGTSFSPLDSDSDRFVAAFESSVLFPSAALRQLKIKKHAIMNI